jgi:hypothetical protein
VVVLGIVDAGEASDACAAEVDDASMAQVVDIGGRPAAIVQLPQVVGGLVVAANCGPEKCAISAI